VLIRSPHTYVCEEVCRISERRNPWVKVLTYLFIYFAQWQRFHVMWYEVEHLAIPMRYISEERRRQLHGSVSLKSSPRTVTSRSPVHAQWLSDGAESPKHQRRGDFTFPLKRNRASSLKTSFALSVSLKTGLRTPASCICYSIL